MAKRKRVQKIMQLDDGEKFDAECLADYFYMEYDPLDEELPYDIYYRDSTRLIVNYHSRRKRTSLGNGKYKSEEIIDEYYEIQKRMKNSGVYYNVFETDNLDELAEVMQMFNDYYYSIGWFVDYQTFMNVFPAYMEEEQ